MATIAALIITIGAVATAITATLDLANRLGIGGLTAVYLGVEVHDVVVQTAAYEEPPASHTPVPTYGVRVPAGNHSSTIVPNYGVRVTAVDRNSPAKRAGLKGGDIITTINGTILSDVDTFKEVMENAEPGDYLRVTIVRGWPVGTPITPQVRPVPHTHRESIRVRLEPR